MNYSRFLAHREQESNLELIAGLLDLEGLETVTATEGPFRRHTIETVKPGFPSIVEQVYTQPWPVEILQQYQQSSTRCSTIIPELGQFGVVCLGIGPRLVVWIPSPLRVPYQVYQPVEDQDIVVLGCFKDASSRVLVVGYPTQIRILLVVAEGTGLELEEQGFVVEIKDTPTVLCGASNGRIFIGTKNGSIFELHYSNGVISQMVPSYRCFLRSLSWWRPVLSTSIDEMTIEELSWHLIIISSDSTLCLFHLGLDGTSSPIFRASLQPKSRSGATSLITVIPLPQESCAFQGLCVFSDGSRLKACLDQSMNSVWDTATRWTQIDWKSSLQFLTIPNQSLPLDQSGPTCRLTHLTLSGDSNFCLISQLNPTDRNSVFSVLELLDSDPKRKLESGALLFNGVHLVPGMIQNLNQKILFFEQDLNQLFRGPDLISQQLRGKSEDLFLILSDQYFTVLRLKKPVELLSSILSILDTQESALSHLKDFCYMYGVTETAAMAVLIDHGLTGALLQNQDLFEGPRFIEKSQLSDLVVPGQVLEGIGMAPMERIRDLEFSKSFKGILLFLRQIVRQIWWKLVFKIQRHEATNEVLTQVSFHAKELENLKSKFKNLKVFLDQFLAPFDPQFGDRVVVTSEVFNIERFELRGIKKLTARCMEAIRLLQFFQECVQIDSVAKNLSESELDALKELNFKKMVTLGKELSPVSGLLRASVKINAKFPAAVNDILKFFVQKTPSYMNESDQNQIKALHGLDQVMVRYLPQQDPMPLKIINGPDRFWRD